MTLHPAGMQIAVLTGKTKHSVRNAKIRYSQDPEVCPVRGWTAYRVAEHGEAWADPSTPAFVGIDRWGRVTGGMVPASVTRAVKRISQRAEGRSTGPATPCASGSPPPPASAAATASPSPTRAAGPATP
ncbi:hypothetical protein [Streptomyces sp. LN590]|uniref:hypothetical protein n=1 Tax=Streptomyces sp. LN590 TaxID=3112980 RepID=UPI0037228C4C